MDGCEARGFTGVRKQGFLSRFPLGMVAEFEEKLQQVVCYRLKDETGGLDLERRKQRRCEACSTPCFTGCPICVSARLDLQVPRAWAGITA